MIPACRAGCSGSNPDRGCHIIGSNPDGIAGHYHDVKRTTYLLDVVVGEGGRQFAEGPGLGEKVLRFLLGRSHGVGAGDPSPRRGRQAGNLHQSSGELGGGAGLLAALARPPSLVLFPSPYVVRGKRRARGHPLVWDELPFGETGGGGGRWASQ